MGMDQDCVSSKVGGTGHPASGEARCTGGPREPFEEGLPAGAAARKEPGEERVAGADGAEGSVNGRLAVQGARGIHEDRPVGAEAGKNGPGTFFLEAPRGVDVGA